MRNIGIPGREKMVAPVETPNTQAFCPSVIQKMFTDIGKSDLYLSADSGVNVFQKHPHRQTTHK
jgi:hypothetical protein